MSLGVIRPLWVGVMIDVNPFFPFIIGAIVMLIGFVASLVYLRSDAPVKARIEIAQ